MRKFASLGRRVLRKLSGRRADQGLRTVNLTRRQKSSPTRYMAVVGIFKNEAPYLAEWVEFYRMLGVEHVYLYDNNSDDNPAAILTPYVESGFVTHVPWNFPYDIGSVDAQILAYAHAVLNFGHDWRWMAFLDLDEFLFPVKGDSLPAVMRQYEDLPAVAGFWMMFGFSGHETPPPGLVIENYVLRAPFPTRAGTKSIVNPAEVVGISTGHVFDLPNHPRSVMTETRELYTKHMGGGHTGIEVNVDLRLHHYYTRSRREFEDKITKRFEAGGKGDKRRAIADKIEAKVLHDDTILRFVPELKKRLAATTGRQ